MKQMQQQAPLNPSQSFKNEKATGIQQEEIVFIRSRLNGLYVTVKDASKSAGAGLVMNSFNGNEEQQFVWRNKCLVCIIFLAI